MARSATRAALRIHEIYRSVQGESTSAGWPCVFVRTAGCDIRCRWCDEPDALTSAGSDTLTLDEVVERVRSLGPRSVQITGGEPLLQPATHDLVRALSDAGFDVSLETGGHHDISKLDPRCRVVLDVKPPGSGMVERNDPDNLARLRPGDELKLVLADRRDYEWARQLVLRHALLAEHSVHFSPVHGELDPKALAEWILEDGLQVRLNLQLHKYIWGSDAKGV